MKRILIYLFFFLLPYSLLSSTAIDLNLTTQEKGFIAQQRVIKYIYDPDWAPFEWENGINEHIGMIADVLKLIEEKSALKFEASHSSSWVEAVEKLKTKKANMASSMSTNSSRKKYLNFTTNRLFSIPYIFVTRNNDFYADGFNSLGNAKLALVKGYAIEEIVKKEYSSLKYETVSNIKEGFLKLLDKKIDVLLLNQATAEYLIKENGYTQLSISYKTSYVLPLKVAINKTYPQEALSIIDKALKTISKEEIHEIYKKYSNAYDSEYSVVLSKEESIWIKKNPIVTFVGDPNWLPFEAFNEKGEYIGIVSEYLSEIEKVTGLKFQKIETSTWEESVNLMREHKVDMISETVDSAIGSYLSFTDAYLDNHIVIVMNRESKYVDNLSVIKNKKIAVIKGYGYVPKIQKAYPYIEFTEVDDIDNGLEYVASGKVDALLCTMALGSYYISKGGFVNLRIVGKTEFSTKIGYGIQPELVSLMSILNKAIAVLENGKKQEILKKWTVQEYVEKIDYTLVRQILGAAIILLSLFWYWNREMRKEIARRIKAEKKQQQMLVQQAKMAAMGEMIDSIAHQWKQPLNAISMLTELAEMDFDENIVDKKYMKEYKEQIYAQVEHLIITLNEFRNFFRPSKHIAIFDAKKALESILLLVKDEFLKNAIEVEIEEDEKLSIEGVENEFKHIILNIINNAKDAFNENDIKNREIIIRLFMKDELKCIEVSDNAGGIPEYIIEDIFKANVTSKKEGKGTGIGLYMSDQIAKKMKGKLSVSNKYSGAAFLLEI